MMVRRKNKGQVQNNWSNVKTRWSDEKKQSRPKPINISSPAGQVQNNWSNVKTRWSDEKKDKSRITGQMLKHDGQTKKKQSGPKPIFHSSSSLKKVHDRTNLR